ncbi:hypothetical protein EHW65_18325 [Erwinia psidii]|uniref:hypothetical protein n=1 Tax=Erwinia psidii TaxID=69224 RepID=UPI00226B353E|nr:hypothetical protein [Erwinia psidii]MCX8959116.1 hypothetical protein [Erwinia psidii]
MNCQKNHDKDSPAWLSKTNTFLDTFTKLIPIIIFFLLASGSFQLLLFTKQHGVRFVDLLQSNFIISFSSIFIFSCAVPIILFSTLLPLNVDYRHRYINFFSKGMCAKLNGSTTLKISLFYFVFSLWPVLIKQSVMVAIAYPIFILTVCFLFKTGKKRVLNDFLIIQLVALLNVFVVMVLIALLALVYGDILNKIPDNTAITFLCVFQFLISMTIFIPWRGKKSPGFFLQCLASLLFLQIFFFSVPDQITSLSIKLSGLGLQKRCFYDEGLRKNNIPDEFITRVVVPSPNAVTKYSSMNIVANPGGVFYLSKDNKKYTAEFRFVDGNLPEISCVAAAAVDPKISH